MPDCIFCRIAAGEIPATVVYDDDLVIAFMDIHPVNPGHLLVVPRQHAALLIELEDAAAARLITTAKRLDSALRRSGVRCEAVNLLLADGEAAGQEVAHVHLHLIPRYAGDGFGLRFPPHYHQAPPTREELAATAAQIKEQLAG